MNFGGILGGIVSCNTPNMPLTDTKLRSLKPVEKDTKLSDSGGLYLLLKPNGSKLWRLKYRLGKKEGVYAIGPYPQITLAQARIERDTAKKLIAEGKNPTTARKLQKLENIAAAENSFEPVAREFYDKLKKQGRTVAPGQAIRLLEQYIFPVFGNVPMPDIKPPMLLTVLRELEKRGVINTAGRVRHVVGQVFRYGIATQRCEYDITASLRGAILVPEATHHKPAENPQAVWKFAETYKGMGTTRHALMALMLTAVRTQELRFMEKTELDFEKALWSVPAQKMKKRRPHVVPLSRQVIAILKEAIDLGDQESPYVFQNIHTEGIPISSATLHRALYINEVGITPHGFRGTFSTNLHEQGFPSEIIELQLAHAKKDKVGAAYNHAKYMTERRAMMQHWADWLTGEKASH